MLEAFRPTLDAVEARARAMVLTGAGRGFCSGAKLGGPSSNVRSEDFDAGLLLETHFNPLMTRLRELKVPWISAVRGAAAGGGASLALAADMIVASESAFFLQAFTNIGLVPDCGSTHLLVRTLGRPRAMELMLLGERLPAKQALEWGLINRVVPDDQLMTEALALAQRLAAGSWSLSAIRDLAWRALDSSWSEALEAEREYQLLAGRTEDFIEGVSAFSERREPEFVGR